jgi:putative copper export protein
VSSQPGAPSGTTDDGVPGPDPVATATAAALVCVAGAVMVVGLLTLTGADEPGTLADPGPATTVGLPLARYLQDLLGVLVVGAALLVALASGPAATRLRARGRRLLGPLAGGWAAVTVVVYLLTASDLSGRTVPLILTPQVQNAFLSLPQARAQLLVLLAAGVLAVAARVLADAPPLAQRAMLAVATLGLLPPAFVGHSAAAEDHELAVASVSVHLVAGALWVGGLAVLAAAVLVDRRVRAEDALPVVRSFSTLALVCVVAVGSSGVLNGSLRISVPEQLLTTPYGLVLVGKAVALAVLVGFGWWHRARSIDAMAVAPGRSAFVRLVVAELVVMVLTVAAAVVLARTPPPGVPGM